MVYQHSFLVHMHLDALLYHPHRLLTPPPFTYYTHLTATQQSGQALVSVSLALCVSYAMRDSSHQRLRQYLVQGIHHHHHPW
ncbi:hypothetical protein SKAU_G00269510 [Synaphobranchus kaupii]|uniref:Uncharacterized protein n=1 Tax=Synaphobranchus kaupii TaxID=118154 RepID=A0A9Q1IQ70_SYNKA|nr:hypothetical protein SKAU_G00269510 [Synaphobranchus kaupii]